MKSGVFRRLRSSDLLLSGSLALLFLPLVCFIRLRGLVDGFSEFGVCGGLLSSDPFLAAKSIVTFRRLPASQNGTGRTFEATSLRFFPPQYSW